MRKERDAKRRQVSLTRTQIVESAIALLDAAGEPGLTFQALAKSLSTGAGAIYWHVENRDDLLAAACDTIVGQALSKVVDSVERKDTIKNVALAVFDAMDEHPWIGSVMNRASAQMPVVRIIERVGAQIVNIGVPKAQRWLVVSALLNYILGVAGQNAANAQFGHPNQLNRSAFLNAAADNWMRLESNEFPIARSLIESLRDHDDRADFIAGLDLILNGIHSL
jgi:AcrR family transcriptional regulator